MIQKLVFDFQNVSLNAHFTINLVELVLRMNHVTSVLQTEMANLKCYC